jgi:hypothetical protein
VGPICMIDICVLEPLNYAFLMYDVLRVDESSTKYRRNIDESFSDLWTNDTLTISSGDV